MVFMGKGTQQHNTCLKGDSELVGTYHRTYAVASGFGPLIPNAGETGCHIPQHWGTEGAYA
jgi:hypothetical protein